MTQTDLSQPTNPKLRGSLAALHRAAEMARQLAIQTNTGIVVMRDGKRVYVSAEELQQDKA